MKRKIFLLFIGIILISTASASFETGSPAYSLDSSYGIGGSIKGWVNLSFDDELTTSLFEDSFGNSIGLLELLDLNGVDVSCNVPYCESDYAATNASTTKSFNAGEETQLVGLKFTKDFTEITSISFDVESNAGSSCFNQLKIDFLNDYQVDSGNTKLSSSDCSGSQDYGCFDSGEELSEAPLDSVTPYCQKVELSESPGFEVGAWVKKTGVGEDNLTMKIYNIAGGDLEKSCVLPSASDAGEEVFCDIEYFVSPEGEYYLCIAPEVGGVYSIRGYSIVGSGCADHSVPGAGFNANAAYQISAKGKKFDAVGKLTISNVLPNSDTLSQMAENYITETYGGFDCAADGCVVPLALISGTSQNLNLENLSIKYKQAGDFVLEDNSFYSLEETPAKITSGFKRIGLDAGNFFISSNKEDYTLELDGTEIFSENISIGTAPIIGSINPTTTASAFPTTFTIGVSSGSNISKYNWEFGDGKKETTKVNYATHTYSATGSYDLKLTITDFNNNSASRNFNITVGSPEEVIETLIAKKKSNIESLKTNLGTLEKFYQDSLNSLLDVDDNDEKLKELEILFESADSEDEYNEILTDLLVIEVPKSIGTLVSADDVRFYPSKENIDLDILTDIGGGDYDFSDEEDYKDAVIFWNQEELETKITFEELSAQYDDYEEPLLRIFKIDVNDEGGISDDPYLIIEKMDDLKFKENYLEEEISGYVYIDLSDDEEIVFSTTEEVSFADVPLFISPDISKLSLSEEGGAVKRFISKKWLLYILILFLILIVGFAVYIILQEWYKRKYENHLFKDRNHLYNIMVFIDNSRKKGLTDKEIEGKLKKAGWSSEQVTYALRKHSGKRTGMFEIPVGRILNKFGKGDSMPTQYSQKTGKFYKPNL